MKNKISAKRLSDPTTINVSIETWQKLSHLKVNGNYRNMDEVIRILLGEKRI